MPIRFPCDECDKPLKVNEKYAGKRVVCPACKAVVRVPEAEEEEKEAPLRPVKKAARATVRAKQSPAEELEEDEEEPESPPTKTKKRAKQAPAEEPEEDEEEEPEPPRTKTRKRPDSRREPDGEPEEEPEPEPSQEEERLSTDTADEEKQQEEEDEQSSPAADDTEDVVEGKLEESADDDEADYESTEQIEELEELGPPLRRRERRRVSASQAATFGLASIIFGVLGVALFWSLFFGLPLAGFGLVLGLVGLLLGIRTREAFSRLSLIGAAASVVALALCMLTGFRTPKMADSPRATQEVKAPVAAPSSPPLAIIPSKPKPPPVPDGQQIEFRTRMLAFVDEASALAELAQVKPNAADFGKKVDALTESYSQIPDSPDSMEAFNKARTIAHQVWADFRGCRQIVELADRVKQYGGDDAYKQALGKLKELSKIQKARLEQIRVLVGQKDAAGDDQPGNG